MALILKYYFEMNLIKTEFWLFKKKSKKSKVLRLKCIKNW